MIPCLSRWSHCFLSTRSLCFLAIPLMLPYSGVWGTALQVAMVPSSRAIPLVRRARGRD